MADYLHITVSQEAEQQAFIVTDVDGAKVITTFTSSGLATGAVFGVPGAIIGGAIGLVTGIFFAIFGDKKKGAMNMYRTLLAEILGQIDPNLVQFNGEHSAVTLNAPANPQIMLDIVRQMLEAFVQTFEYGSDDHGDALLALNSVKLEEFKPCCNRTIVTFEVLESNGITNILQQFPGGTAGILALGVALFGSK